MKSEPVIIRGIDQHTEEWLDIRRGVLTGSQFERVMTPGKLTKATTFKKTAARIAAERLGWIGQPGFQSPVMDQGTENEPQTVAAYSIIEGADVELVTFVYSDETQRVGCSPDGLVGESGVFEGKYPDLPQYLVDRDERQISSSSYRGQVYGHLWVTQREWCDWVSYHDGFMPVIVRTLATDEKYLAWVKKWESYVSQFIALVDKFTEDPERDLVPVLEKSIDILPKK